MVLGSLGAGIAGGATVAIVIKAIDEFSGIFTLAQKKSLALGAAITAVGIAGAIAVGGLIKMAGQFEQTNIAFTTMLGSAELAKSTLKDLSDFAIRTPFQIPEVEQNAKLLLAMGIEVDKLIPTMKALGDVSAGLNVPLQRIALNFGQVKTQGKLTGRELRDFNIAGVPLLQEIAKNMGLTEKAIKEMTSAGEIGFDEVEKAFITMSSSGGKFFDLMDAQSKTFLGKVSNIQDSFIRLGRIMGEVFLPAASVVAGILEKIIGFMSEHPLMAKFVVVTLALASAFAIVGGAIILVGALFPLFIAGWGLITAGIGSATIALITFEGLLTIITGPIGLVVGAIGLLVAAIVFLTGNAEEATDSVEEFTISMDEATIASDKLEASISRTSDAFERLFTIEKQTKDFERSVGFGTRQDLPGPGTTGRGVLSSFGTNVPISDLSIPELFGEIGTPITRTGARNKDIIFVNQGTIVSANSTDFNTMVNGTINQELINRGI